MVNLGYAVDLGTTTIDACVVNLDDMTVIASRSRKNPQSLYGSDVINRILNASRSKENYDRMRKLVTDALLEMLQDMLNIIFTENSNSEVNRLTNKEKLINCIVISGNTTMISILLGYELEGLGRAPFETVLKSNVTIKADTFFENEAFNCNIIFTGCAGAFLGGDILSGIVYLEKENQGAFLGDKNSLLIDLGTNGEMVLNSSGKLYGSSTACGPAFEGCVRKQGIYGSTVVDTLCLLLRTGKLSRDGVLEEHYMEDGITINNVHIDMDIVRSILMAKAAIYSGICCLVKEACLSLKDIEEVYIAGGFGFYLDVDNSIEIGLIPKEFKNKIRISGNTSLKGAINMLYDKDFLGRVDELSKGKITLVQLADSSEYKEMLVNNMTFRR